MRQRVIVMNEKEKRHMREMTGGPEDKYVLQVRPPSPVIPRDVDSTVEAAAALATLECMGFLIPKDARNDYFKALATVSEIVRLTLGIPKRGIK